MYGHLKPILVPRPHPLVNKMVWCTKCIVHNPTVTVALVLKSYKHGTRISEKRNLKPKNISQLTHSIVMCINKQPIVINKYLKFQRLVSHFTHVELCLPHFNT